MSLDPEDVKRAIHIAHRTLQAQMQFEKKKQEMPYDNTEMTYTLGALHQLRVVDRDNPDWSDERKYHLNMMARTIARLEGCEEVNGMHVDLAAEVADGMDLHYCPDCHALAIAPPLMGSLICPGAHTTDPMLRIAFPEESND